MPEEPVLDMGSALKLLAGDMDIYRDVVQTYLEDTPRLLAELRTAVERGGSEVSERHAHSVKSSSRTVGGMRLGALAERAEEKALAGDLSGMGELLEKMKEGFADLKQALAGMGIP